MTHVVTENCDKCYFTDCVEVCPVSCFYTDSEEATMLYINPDECIDCRLCVDQCPVEAIYAEEDCPEEQEAWIEINAEKSQVDGAINIAEKQDPYPGADERKEELGF